MSNSNLNNNKDLIFAIQKGDKKAFKLLFEDYYKGLVGYITTYTQDIQLSEDIVQHSFITLWNKKDRLKTETSPKNYLYTIAYNRYIDLYRKKQRESDLIKQLTLSNLQDNINENNDVLEKRIAKLKKIIEHLPPRCKEVLYLSKQRGLDYNEISEKLNISSRTVEEQIRIAFKKIRKGFKENSFLFLLFKRCCKKINL